MPGLDPCGTMSGKVRRCGADKRGGGGAEGGCEERSEPTSKVTTGAREVFLAWVSHAGCVGDGLLSQTHSEPSLSGTFLQTLPELVTPLKGHSLSPRGCQRPPKGLGTSKTMEAI